MAIIESPALLTRPQGVVERGAEVVKGRLCEEEGPLIHDSQYHRSC